MLDTRIDESRNINMHNYYIYIYHFINFVFQVHQVLSLWIYSFESDMFVYFYSTLMGIVERSSKFDIIKIEHMPLILIL